jgi:hypothetical protein
MTEVKSSSIINGNTKSCGCLHKEVLIKHNKSKSSIHQIWMDMKQRCLNPNNNAYKHYGGRGIKVCERWYNFENFLADMDERPKGKTLDRIDNNGNYGPSNCKWSTPKEQLRNKRNVRLSENKVENIRKLIKENKLKEIALMFNVHPSVITNIKLNKTWCN